MRWDPLVLGGSTPESAPLPIPGAVERTFDTPQFRGMTFYEVQARSILNKVPEASRMPFRWTLNPYRGCSHACVYCFARNTHTYLDLDAGYDFDRKVIVKVNAPQLLRRELARPTWRGEHIAMGTNTDPYQRAEGRYQLMRGILGALRDAANPFSVLTKGSLVVRDLDLLRECADRAEVAVNLSIGSVDATLWRQVEPGTPSPQRRLGVCRELVAAGLGCGVLIAPVLPFLTDSEEALDETVEAIARAGAHSVTAIPLHLRPGAREWWFRWLRESRPDLVDAYERLYRKGYYAPPAYRDEIAERVRRLARRHRVGAAPAGAARRVSPPAPRREPAQLLL